MTVRLDNIRECFEGVIPGHIVTCDPDGTPNLAYLSQVEFIDNSHVALSYQFFNRTRQNVLADSPVRLLLTSHFTAAQYRLTLRYLRTETTGPLFEQMRAKLAGIAAHTGMSGVFKLLGSDIYEVLAIEAVDGQHLPLPAPRANYLTALRRATARLGECPSLAALTDAVMACLSELFGFTHAMLLMYDGTRDRLYTLASHGYAHSGVGSEIAGGVGVIGICARERTPIRIGFMNAEYAYGRTIRDAIAAAGQGDALETAIPLPGLPDAASQLAVPITAGGRLLGVIYVESRSDMHFGHDEEDALVTFAGQIGLAMLPHQQADEGSEDGSLPEEAQPLPDGQPLRVRYFAANDSVFINDDYLIKGVAGAILWTLLGDFVERQRTSFTNKGLRVDPRIRLPGVSDNLEARLLLLQRRLDERQTGIHLSKTGRGRFSLRVARPVTLQQD